VFIGGERAMRPWKNQTRGGLDFAVSFQLLARPMEFTGGNQ
jgi:hypothetical protein